jgi:lysophospholipase L1-like esterase
MIELAGGNIILEGVRLMHKRIQRRLGLSVVLLSIMFISILYGAVGTFAATGDGSLSDSNVKYFGRWDKSSSTVYKSYWGGAYLKVNFTGTTVKLKLAASANIYVNIDNTGDTYYPGANGTVNVTPTPLVSETHSLRVAARSETDVLQFQGLIIDSDASTQDPAANGSIIEFVGDSITAGYNNTKWALSDYAWLTGEQLNAEHVQIAYGGICLQDTGCYSPNSIGMSRQFFKLQTVDYPTSPDWDFSIYQPSTVVINLGSNDDYKNVSDSVFQSTYTTFLQNIRAQYAASDIFVLRPFNGAKAVPAEAAVNARNTAGDTKVHYVDTTGWLTAGDFQADGVHPSDSGQIKAANLLAPIIQPYIAPEALGQTNIYAPDSNGIVQ